MANIVILTGRLTKDPVTSYTQSSKAVCKFTLAVNREFKKDEADFIQCVCFDKTAELVNKWFYKGHAITVVGRIQTGKYEKDGRTVYTTDVIVNRIEFPMGKNERKGDAYEGSTEPEAVPEPVDVDELDDLDGGLPF